MTPAAKLRFVERRSGKWVFEGIHGSEACCKQEVLKVLQQWWVAPESFDMITGQPAGEWRDVPLEQEEK